MDMRVKLKTTHFVELDSVSFAYPGRTPALREVSLKIAPGSFHSLIGRSGCGKTTVLKLAAGLLVPPSGQVFLQGQPVREPSAAMGFVFQAPTLLDWLDVLDNVLLPLSLHDRVSVEQRAKAIDSLAQLGLTDLGSCRDTGQNDT